MSTLPGFWHAAARMTGRIDFSQSIQNLGIGESLRFATSEFLADSGIGATQRHVLRVTRDLQIDSDWLCLDDEAYPEVLRKLPFAPPVLFFRGDPTRMAGLSLAVVGARRCTMMGIEIAESFSRFAVGSNLVVVSGMARGIDQAAHRGARGRTIAVLGQGLASPMSASRRGCLGRILETGGLVLSEFLPHLPASRWTFPQRNRIIAGLSRSVLVVEATRRSGALITARHALEYGRDVLAVPGHPGQPLAQGCLKLLREGARMVASRSDLEDALGVAGVIPTAHGNLLDGHPCGVTLSELVIQTGRTADELREELSEGVLLGTTRILPGGRFIRRNDDR